MVLLDVNSRGRAIDPKLATGDGALGFWKALPKVFPPTCSPHCWVHKTANVLDQLSKRLQPERKNHPYIWMADTRDAAN
jgi:putative transposase